MLVERGWYALDRSWWKVKLVPVNARACFCVCVNSCLHVFKTRAGTDRDAETGTGTDRRTTNVPTC